jgi:dihydrofolate reductase
MTLHGVNLNKKINVFTMFRVNLLRSNFFLNMFVYSRKRMIVAAIVVTDLNNGIGKDNKLLCHLPADLKFFKSITMGCPVIMGRKTYESIGRLLPGRRNIIITRSADYKVNGAEIYHSIEAALKSCERAPAAIAAGDPEKEEVPKEEAGKVFIIGGSEIFKQSWDMIQEIYRTVITHRFEADVFFPELKSSEFDMLWGECHHADEKNPYDYCFEKWARKKPGK